MPSTRFRRWSTPGAIAALALVLAACGGSSGDKAGGEQPAQPRVLTIESGGGGEPPAQMAAFAKELERTSGGTLELRFVNDPHPGDPEFEVHTLADVQEGRADMAWVGARAFDRVGVTSFQPLLAPLLIDSYELQGRVFDAGLPDQMLGGVEELDLVGIGVLPGPMRKLLGVTQPFATPEDFAGRVVGLQDSAVADATLRALGATPKVLPAAAPLDGIEGYEQQLSSIWGNGYENVAGYVTGNVNLWPRPLVIVMADDVFASLDADQQRALREAAAAAVPAALAASRGEDAEAGPVLCRKGLAFVDASPADLAELRARVEPVYATIGADAADKARLDAISSLKQTHAIAAEAPVCADEPQAVAADAPLPDGRYQVEITRDDWIAAGLSEAEAAGETTGVFTMVFDAGVVKVLQPPVAGQSPEVGLSGTYTVFRDRIEVVSFDDEINAAWSLDGDQLTLSDVVAPGVPFEVVWGSHPWTRVDEAPAELDGTYRASVSRDELADSPLLMDAGEVNDQNWGQLTLTFDQGRVAFEQANDAESSSTAGTYTVDGDVVVLDFTEGVNAGERFSFRWSLYRDTLTFERDQALGIVPTPYVMEPWERVG